MNQQSEESAHATRTLILLAFGVIYIVWGSTYLGIHIAIESIPPFVMGAMRFLAAGVALYAWLRWCGVPNPSPAQWRNAAIVGALLLGGGNGGVSWAQQRVPSNVTALIVAIAPVWFTLLDWARPSGKRPQAQTLLGIAVGFTGMLLLVGSRESLRQSSLDLVGAAVLLASSLCWAGGSLYSRYTPKPAAPLMAVAQQMICGGVLLFLMSAGAGELRSFSFAQITTRSWLALLYLTVIGSLVAFSAYSWLLNQTTPARLSTYAYVNPVIALFLGWLVLGEHLTPRMLGAAAVILLGVVIITTRRSVASPPTIPSPRRAA